MHDFVQQMVVSFDNRQANIEEGCYVTGDVRILAVIPIKMPLMALVYVEGKNILKMCTALQSLISKTEVQHTPISPEEKARIQHLFLRLGIRVLSGEQLNAYLQLEKDTAFQTRMEYIATSLPDDMGGLIGEDPDKVWPEEDIWNK